MQLKRLSVVAINGACYATKTIPNISNDEMMGIFTIALWELKCYKVLNKSSSPYFYSVLLDV